MHEPERQLAVVRSVPTMQLWQRGRRLWVCISDQSGGKLPWSALVRTQGPLTTDAETERIENRDRIKRGWKPLED